MQLSFPSYGLEALSSSLSISSSDTLNKFIRRIIGFILIGVVYFLTTLVINLIIFNFAKPPIKNADIFILGDSHTQTALNPDCFFSAINLSQGAEPIIVSFWKIRYLINKTEFDTLIMGFSYQNISEFNDERLVKSTISTELFKRTYSIQRFKDIRQLPIDHLKNFKVYFKYMCLFPRTKHYNFIGNYEGIRESSISNSELRIRKQFFDENNEIYDISDLSINYLDSIIKLCHSCNKKLILISTPLQRNYYNIIPIKFKMKYEELLWDIKAQNVLLLDFSNHPIGDEYFYDADHLTHEGSKIFSLHLKEALRSLTKY